MLISALCIYGAICAALFVLQRALIYLPQPRAEAAGAPMRFNHAGADLAVSVQRHAGPRAVLYFGGNAEDVARSLPELAAAFPDRAIYLLHFRGYGGSSGRPSEKAIFSDALALFEQVRSEHSDITVVGRSLGSGVAVYLASQRAIQRLTLVTPFDSLEALASRQFPFVPVRWLLRDKFLSWQYARQVTAPTTLVAAEHDEVVPRENTMRLADNFRAGVAMLTLLPDTGHNDISLHPQYINAIGGAP